MAEEKIDFIGIGAAKSGTTWLTTVLRQHPEIFLSKVKEIHYFNQYRGMDHYEPNKNYKKPVEWYHDFFKDAKSNQVKGEFTPSYLRNENCPADIYNYNPNVKLIALFRNPIERTKSQYLFGIQWGIIPAKFGFEDAIKKYPVLLTHSLYYRQMHPYFSYFPKQNVKVLIYENMITNKDQHLKEICRFLEIDEDFKFNTDYQINETKSVKFSKFNYLIRKTHPFFNSSTKLYHLKQLLQKAGVSHLVAGLNAGKKISVKDFQIKPETEKYLRDYFAEDVNKLEKLLITDLSIWKK